MLKSMGNQNHHRYNHDIKRYGIIYKHSRDAEEYFETRLKDTQYSTIICIERDHEGVISRVETEWDFSKCGNHPSALEEPTHNLFTFHKMVQEGDAHNVSGMRFNSFYFCSSYSQHTLNYLMTRIKS